MEEPVDDAPGRPQRRKFLVAGRNSLLILKMDDEYVQVYLWHNQVAQLPKPVWQLVRPTVFPIVGRVIQRAVTSALNPVQLLGNFFERRSGDLLVDILKRVYSL